jgi:pyruvate ferredoxin oxidoreductase alpha subunit
MNRVRLVSNVFPVSKLARGRTPFKVQPGLDLGKGEIRTLVGNHCVGEAVRQAILANSSGSTAAYPITPATEILHYLRELEAKGKIHSIGFNASSEHEAMTAAIAASYGGTRSFIATAAVGFMHMMEMVEWAGQNRVPVVMALANRANAPLNIWFGDDDRVRARDFTVQLVAENHQQSYDLTLQAFRIAETAYWTTIINLAGFFISHSSDRVRILDDETAIDFVGKFTPLLDPFAESISKGGLTSPRAFPLQRAQNFSAWAKIKGIVQETHDKFAGISGRGPGAFFNTYYVDETTKYLFLNYGFLSGTLRTLVDILRREGVSVGLISGTLYRPFPDQELIETIAQQAPNTKIIGVFDGALDSVPGATFTDINLAFNQFGRDYYSKWGPHTINYKFGGGQNPSLSVLNGALWRMIEAAKQGRVDYPIQQLDRNTDGPNILLDLAHSRWKEISDQQAIIEFVGRGGLGAVSAAANLVAINNTKSAESQKIGEQAAFSRGVPEFGSEKTGSPTFGVAVIDQQPTTTFNFDGPRDLYVFFRPDLISSKHIANIKENGFFLVNTNLSPAEIRRRYNIPEEIKIYTISASRIARQKLGKDFPNNILLAVLSHLRPNLLSIDDLKAAISKSLRKKGQDIIAKNLALIDEAKASLKEEENTII